MENNESNKKVRDTIILTVLGISVFFSFVASFAMLMSGVKYSESIININIFISLFLLIIFFYFLQKFKTRCNSCGKGFAMEIEKIEELSRENGHKTDLPPDIVPISS